MLSISFYSVDGQSPHSIRVVDDFYEWLAKSDFSKVGKSRKTRIEVEGEKADLPLVRLGSVNRKRLIAFFSETIFRETKAMLTNLEDPGPKEDLATKAYRLRKLFDLLDCLKSETYQYLQRE